MKDKLFFRLKANNVIQLIDLLITQSEMYYQRRLLDVALNRIDCSIRPRYLPSSKEKCESLETKQLKSETFEVHNEKNAQLYHVNMMINICSCKFGINGAPCKHQYVVTRDFNLSSFSFLPVNDPQMRLLLHEIATGSMLVPQNWFVHIPFCANFTNYDNQCYRS